MFHGSWTRLILLREFTLWVAVTMQSFKLTAITAAEKCTLFLDNVKFSRLDVKFLQSLWSVKCRSRVPGHGACLKSMPLTITMQVFILPAITAAEKSTMM